MTRVLAVCCVLWCASARDAAAEWHFTPMLGWTILGTTSIVDGGAYIFQVAAARGEKAVVNLSLSSQSGAHDGTYGFDTMINALTGT